MNSGEWSARILSSGKGYIDWALNRPLKHYRPHRELQDIGGTERCIDKKEKGNVRGRLTLTDRGFKPLQGAVQPFPIERGDRLKLDADFACAAPANDGMFDQNRRLAFRETEEEIYLHSFHGVKGSFEPASFAREIQ